MTDEDRAITNLAADVTEQQEIIDRLEAEVADLRRLIDHWRATLRFIANDNSGPWGWLAHEALKFERKP